jgi:hypothetical protein
VFALGGVLYDIAAVITGNKTMLDYRATESDTRLGNAEESSTARNGLHEAIKETDDESTKKWLIIIDSMLHFDPAKRPSAISLLPKILVKSAATGERFCENCFVVCTAYRKEASRQKASGAANSADNKPRMELDDLMFLLRDIDGNLLLKGG